jgi:2-dehydropantoate 2-reductase
MSTYAVIGTGALGGYYGGLLARNGNDIHFLMRTDADHVRVHGLRVDSKNGDFVIPSVHAYKRVEEMPKCDFIIVALKSTQNEVLKELLPYVMHDQSYAVVLQNGLHVEASTESIVGKGRVMGGCCFLCSNKVGPGHIRHLDYGTILLGPYLGMDGKSPAVPRPVVESVIRDFSAASITIEGTDSLQMARWKKLMWNIPFNGLSVVLNASTDQIMQTPASRRLAEATMREVREAAMACGESIPESHVDMLMDHTDKMVPYDSSMRLDSLAGRPMEIQAIFGNPLVAAKHAGFSAKIVQTIHDQLLFLQETRKSAINA